jgi:hypothetical protein
VINNSQNRLEKSKSRRSEDDDATRPKKKHKSSPTVPTTTEFLPGAIDIKKRSTESPSKTLSNSSVTGKTAKSKTKTKQEPTTNEHPQATPTTHEKAADESDEDSDGDPSQIVHESLLRGSQKSKSTKYRPEGETDEQRNARTLFVGNVPAAAVKEKVRLLSTPSPIFHSFYFSLVGRKIPQTTYSLFPSNNLRHQNRIHTLSLSRVPNTNVKTRLRYSYQGKRQRTPT